MGLSARTFLRWAVCAAATLVFGPATLAADIAQRLPSGLTAHADFRPGEPGRPAVLLLHGFMTTQNFSTIRTIANELEERGYTVLAPTLTLGIDERRGGLPCEAIHTHTMEGDLAELAWWAEWLGQRHPGPMVLIGHSTGSLQGLAYAATDPAIPLAAVIATSPVYFGQDYPPQTVAAQIARAQTRIADGEPGLDRYALTFCERSFVATPQSYLSYAAWNRERVLEAVRRIAVPVRVVLGSRDARATELWQSGLREAGATVTVLAGATHFFDATHEFDLLDLIASNLQQVRRRDGAEDPS